MSNFCLIFIFVILLYMYYILLENSFFFFFFFFFFFLTSYSKNMFTMRTTKNIYEIDRYWYVIISMLMLPEIWKLFQEVLKGKKVGKHWCNLLKKLLFYTLSLYMTVSQSSRRVPMMKCLTCWTMSKWVQSIAMLLYWLSNWYL